MTRKSRLGIEPLIDPSAKVTQSKLGHYTEVGARTKITETTMDDYSYIVNDGDVIYTTIGKFCSIAAHVRINPGNHPMQRATQAHFTYRASDYFDDVEDEETFFDWRRAHAVTIGHDVWIGHGVVVLPGCHIGTGAVIAAGAVVSKGCGTLYNRRRHCSKTHQAPVSRSDCRTSFVAGLVGLAA